MNRWLLGALVLVGALLAAFFITFNSLFADGPSNPLNGERLLTYLLVLVAHAALGFVGGKWGPGSWKGWAALACGPSVVLALLYASRETNVLLLALLYALLAIVAAAAGAKVGRGKPLRP